MTPDPPTLTLVDRLRYAANYAIEVDTNLLDEAADSITQARAELERRAAAPPVSAGEGREAFKREMKDRYAYTKPTHEMWLAWQAALAWLDTCSDLKYRDAASLIRQLAAERAADAADARRYRRLKQIATDIKWDGHHVVRQSMHCLDVCMDAAITSAGGTTDE